MLARVHIYLHTRIYAYDCIYTFTPTHTHTRTPVQCACLASTLAPAPGTTLAPPANLGSSSTQGLLNCHLARV